MLFLAPTILIHIGYSPLAMLRSWQTDRSFGLLTNESSFNSCQGQETSLLLTVNTGCGSPVSGIQWIPRASSQEQTRRSVNLTTHLRITPKLRMNREVVCFPCVPSSLAHGRIHFLATV